MSTLEITDIYEVYYDGRERFPHLPQPSDAEADTVKKKRGKVRGEVRDDSATKTGDMPLAH